MFDALQVQPGAAPGGFSGEAPQTKDKLRDFTVGLKVYEEASDAAVGKKMQRSKDVSFSDIEKPICTSVLTASD